MTDVEELSESACWRLLGSATIGRLAVHDGAEIDIFPINFLVVDDAVYFRSAPGGKLERLAADGDVAFEADGRDGPRVWSVVLRGTARRLDDDAEIQRSGIRELRTAHDERKYNYVRIDVRSITGRRFTPAGSPRPPESA